MMPTTSFELLCKAKFKKDRYRRLAKALGGIRNYGRNTPITLLKILDVCGLYNAVWSLRACPHSEKFALEFAYDCAEHALRFRNDQLNQVLEVARRITFDKATADEIFMARATLEEAMRKVNTPSDALATSMVFSLLSEPSLETPFSVATRAAAYVDHMDSKHHYPPWRALQYEMEWQERHLREMLLESCKDD